MPEKPRQHLGLGGGLTGVGSPVQRAAHLQSYLLILAS